MQLTIVDAYSWACTLKEIPWAHLKGLWAIFIQVCLKIHKHSEFTALIVDCDFFIVAVMSCRLINSHSFYLQSHGAPSLMIDDSDRQTVSKFWFMSSYNSYSALFMQLPSTHGEKFENINIFCTMNGGSSCCSTFIFLLVKKFWMLPILWNSG